MVEKSVEEATDAIGLHKRVQELERQLARANAKIQTLEANRTSITADPEAARPQGDERQVEPNNPENNQPDDVLQQAEQALRESEARFRQLADAMPQLVWTAQPDGTVDYYNSRYREFEGISSNMDGKWSWSLVLHPNDLQPTVESWTRSVATGEVYQIEHRTQMADGSFRWHLSRGIPVRDEENKIVKWFGTATDIHGLKLVQEKLRDRNERLALLSDAAATLLSSLDPVALLDRIYSRLSVLLGLEVYIQYNLAENGTYLELGAMAGFPEESRNILERLEFGLAVCGSVALTHQPIVVNDVQRSTDQRTELIRSLGITAYACHPLIVHDRLIGTLSFGTRKHTHFDPESISLLRTVCDLVATAMDRRRADIELKAYARQLERSNRDLLEFAFVASHDLQEPLRKIEAFGETLLQKTSNLTNEQRDYLGRMRKSADRMRSMVDSLLQLSRLSTRAQSIQRVNLSQVVADVLSELELQIQRSGGKVEVGDLPTVEADPLQMQQLFQNLIHNAIKFQAPGVAPRVKIYARETTPATVQVVVEDNGIGFDEEYVERIFEPFQRLVGRSEYEGSGMGLSICRRIVERHGGEITAQSRSGQGAIFTVKLPVKQNRSSLEGKSKRGKF